MVWMYSFCFCCSVRLGVIVCGVVSTIHAIITCVILSVIGMPILSSAKSLIKLKEQYKENMFLWNMLDSISKNSFVYMASFQAFIAVHILNSLLAIYGALRLRKWYLVPYVVSQSCLAILGTTQHIISMRILKNVVTLEMLIGFTLLGVFFMAFLGYSGTTALSLFQIIVLINSQEYKALYGDDPFAPNPTDDNCRRSVKKVEIFYIFNNREISCVQEMIRKRRETQNVVSVNPLR